MAAGEAAAKLDLKKVLKEFYRPSAKEPALVELPSFNYLMVDGAGDPNSSEAFQAAMGALFTVGYTLKFMLKKDPEAATPDFAVMPPEALWWNTEQGLLDPDNKSVWRWTLMMLQPEFVTADMVARAKAGARARKGDLPKLDDLRYERYREELSVQIMHVSPYEAERPTIERLHAFARERGCTPHGKHHEIYLGDPRRPRSSGPWCVSRCAA
jgi:hypothetical protein